MLRYFLLLTIVCITWYGCTTLESHMVAWRTLPQPAAATPAVDTLKQTAMPADDLALQTLERKLAELGQSALLETIGHFNHYRQLSKILGQTSEAVATLAETSAWDQQHPDAALNLTREVLGSSLAIELAAANIAPPTTGRDGRNFHASFSSLGSGLWQEDSTYERPFFYFVVSVRNQLPATALSSFDFYAVTLNANHEVVPLPLPERSYFWCSYQSFANNSGALAAGSVMPLLCEIRIGGIEPVPAAQITAILDDIRTGKLQLAAWPKQMELALPASRAYSSLQLRDHMVSAEFNHPPSSKVEASFIGALQQRDGPPVYRGRETTCEERGNCLQTRLAPFEALVSNARILLTGTILGVLLAGLVALLANNRTQRIKLLGGLVMLNLLVFPIAYSLGGSGWGPLAMLIITTGVSAGFWLGIILGLVCIPATDSPTPNQQA